MRSSRRRVSPDVDLTPLVDILFTFILFFVLTTSFVRNERRLAVDLPVGRGEAVARESAVIAVTRSGDVVIDGAVVVPERMPETLDILRKRTDDVLVKGDANAPYGVVASLLDLLRRRGFSSAGLVLAPSAGEEREGP
jgi:biopolymer transport protein ExbD